jgi:MscS family membrane protein
MSRPAPRIVLTGLLLTALAAPAAAQLPGLAPQPAPSPSPEPVIGDPFRRETPRSSFLGFISAAQKENWTQAAEYLEFRGTPSKEARERLARQFEAVLDRDFTGDLEKLSRSPLGALEDGQPADVDSAGQIQFGGESVDVLLVRVTPPDGGVPYWVVSSRTLRDIPRLAADVKAPALDEQLPGFLNRRFGTIRVWQIAGLLAGFPLLVVLFWFTLRFAGPYIRKPFARKFPAEAVREATGRLRTPVAFLLAVATHGFLAPYLALPLFDRYRYQRTFQVFLVFGVAFLLLRIIGVLMGSIGQRLAAEGAKAPPTLSLARRFLSGAVVVFAFLTVLALWGVDLTATLAGLGIGGVALAFAARTSIENVFGGLTVLGDKILRVGDFCRIGTFLGTIEDITLFATRLRSVDRTIVSIPNGTLLSREIENLSRRDKFWFHPVIGVRYETTPAQIRTLVESIRTLLSGDSRVEPASLRARFIRFGDSSLDIEVFAYVGAPDWPTFLAIQEELLLAIMELVAAAGTSVAFPSRTLYLAKDAPPSVPPP